MAGRAQRSRKIRGNVVRHRPAQSLGAGPGCLVTAIAIGVRRREIVIVVDVAQSAGGGCVGASQGKTGGSVIEGSDIGPRNRVVARGAVGRCKLCACRWVWRIIGGLPGGKVAAGITAIGGLDGQGIVAADVALRAGGNFARRCQLVGVRQGESGTAVVEHAGRPCGNGMAGGTRRSGRWEVGSDVVRDISAQGLGAVPRG